MSNTDINGSPGKRANPLSKLGHVEIPADVLSVETYSPCMRTLYRPGRHAVERLQNDFPQPDGPMNGHDRKFLPISMLTSLRACKSPQNRFRPRVHSDVSQARSSSHLRGPCPGIPPLYTAIPSPLRFRFRKGLITVTVRHRLPLVSSLLQVLSSGQLVRQGIEQDNQYDQNCCCHVGLGHRDAFAEYVYRWSSASGRSLISPSRRARAALSVRNNAAVSTILPMLRMIPERIPGTAAGSRTRRIVWSLCRPAPGPSRIPARRRWRPGRSLPARRMTTMAKASAGQRPPEPEQPAEERNPNRPKMMDGIPARFSIA